MKIQEYRRRARAALAIVLALALAYAAQSILLRNGYLAGGLLVFLVAASLALYVKGTLELADAPTLSRNQVLAIMVVILLAGAGVRFWDLASIPQGVWFDEAQNGLVATRILTDPGYKPIYISDLTQLPALYFYYLAGWIAAVGSNILAVRLAAAALGLLTIPGVFLLGRELFSQRVGLVAAFLLSQSRWHVNFSRFGMNGIAAPFCLVFALYFFARGVRTGKTRDFVLGGVSIGLGLNSYLAFNVVPLLIVGWLSILLMQRRLGFIRQYGRQIVLSGIVALIVISPLALFAVGDRQAFLARTQTASLFTGKSPEEARQALASNIIQHAEMFNIRGDRNGRHNLAGSAELDDVTGAFFVLGIVFALVGARQSRFALLLLWLVLLLLPGVLSLDFEAPQSYRSIGVIPVTSLLAALPIAYAWNIVWRWLGSISVRVLDLAVTCVLLVAGYSNFDVYWFRQIWDNASWAEFSTQATLIAREANRLGPTYSVYMDPVFVGQPTISFVAPQLTNQLPFDPSTVLPFRIADNAVVFGSDANLSWVNAVRQDYPDGVYRSFSAKSTDPPILYEAIILSNQVQSVQGLTGEYTIGTAQDSKPAFRRLDKTIDFHWGQAPPVPPPFTVTWRGTLKAPIFGDYTFRLDGPASARFNLDHAPVVGGGQLNKIRLAQGTHDVDVTATFTTAADLRLSWQTPGGLQQVIPTDALFQPPVRNRGLQASFFPNSEWSGAPTIQRIDPDVSKHYHQLPLEQPFTVEWTGKIDLPTTGLYQFGTQSIDSSWLFLDGRLLVDNSRQLDQYVEAAVNLPEGLHDIKIRFLDKTGHSFIDAYWQPPGGVRSLIPGARVFPPMAAYPDRAGPLDSTQTTFTPSVASTTSSASPIASSQPGATSRPVPAAADVPLIGTLPTSTLQLRRTIGGKGTSPGQFVESRGVAVDTNGNVAVVDAGAKRVDLFDKSGNFMRAIGTPGTGDGQFVDPTAATFDSDGNLLVLDSETGWIHRFAHAEGFAGKFGGPSGSFYHPRGIALDASGTIFIADTGTGRIAVYNANGEALRSLGEHGTKPGQLAEPTGVAVAPDGSLIVTDSTAHTIGHFDSSFQLLRLLGIAPSDTVNGSHVAIGDAGDVYVSDPGDHRVIHLDNLGQPVDQIGAAGQMARPVAVAVDKSGNLYVADSELDQVLVFGQ